MSTAAEVLQRAVVAGLGLIVYDWVWGVLTRLSRLLTDALLGLPWVADGVERMLETLLIGGAAGTAVAAEFVIPMLVLCAGGALLGLLVRRVGLEVMTALVHVLGGLALGASVTGFGRRMLEAWMVAAGAVMILPLLWTVVFVTGAALMLDARPAAGGGFLAFVAQLYCVVAALAVFALAITLAKGVFRQAGGAIAGIAHAPATGRATSTNGRHRGHGRSGGERHSGRLARFSRQLRSGAVAAAGAGARAASFPVRHPVHAARGVRAGAVLAPVRTRCDGPWVVTQTPPWAKLSGPEERPWPMSPSREFAAPATETRTDRSSVAPATR